LKADGWGKADRPATSAERGGLGPHATLAAFWQNTSVRIQREKERGKKR